MYRSIAAIMIVVVLMMGYGTWGGYKMVTQSTPLIDAAMEIRLSITEAHLWFEEIVGGDTAEDIANVWKKLDEAERLTRAMLEGASGRVASTTGRVEGSQRGVGGADRGVETVGGEAQDAE